MTIFAKLVGIAAFAAGLGSGIGAEEESKSLYSRASALHEEAAELESEAADLRAAIDSMAAEFQSYRERYRLHARIAAVGESLGDLLCPNGRRYEDAVVRRITDVGIEIRHAGGSARLSHDCLPVNLRERFQWSAEEAALVLAKEEKDELVRAHIDSLAAERRKEKRALEAKVASLDSRISSLTTQLARVARTSRLQTSGRLGERRSVGGSTIYYRPSYYGSRYRSSRYSGGPSYCYPSAGSAVSSGAPSYRPTTSSSWCPSSTPRRIVISKSTTAPTRTSSPYLPTP